MSYIDDYGIDRDLYDEKNIILIQSEYFYSWELVGEILERDKRTIDSWYKWFVAQPQDVKEQINLPVHYNLTAFTRGHVGRPPTAKKWFRYKDIKRLIKFRDSIKYGMMSQHHRDYSWGKRGQDIRKKYGNQTKIKKTGKARTD